MVERLKREAAPPADQPLLKEEDLPAIAKTIGDLYKVAVPALVKLVGGGKVGDPRPLTSDEETAARAVIELGVKVYKRAILENNVAVVLAIGLSAPVIVRLTETPAPKAIAA